MANLQSVPLGMFLLVLHGLAGTTLVVSGKVLKNAQWPYFRFSAVGSALLVLCFVVMARWYQVELPTRGQRKWVLLRGVFGAIQFMCMILAVRSGVAPGDASAKGSINSVVAAFLGRIVLGEKLRAVHGLALLCCMGGVVLITRPAFLFGGDGGNLLGFLLAASNGCGRACIFICSRKAGKASPLLLSLSSAVFCSICFAILPLFQLVNDYSLEPLSYWPYLAVAFVVAFVVVDFTAKQSLSLAAQLCPAAVSATMSTCCSMAFGFVAQTLLFGQTPDALSLMGASLMFLSVLAMALLRAPAPAAPAEAPTSVVPDARHAPATTVKSGSDHDDNESLASFISKEYVECDAHSQSSLRHRAKSTSVEAAAAAQCVGAAFGSAAEG